METVSLVRRHGLFDRHGQIVPTESALRLIERDYPHKEPHEKWRLAQAQTLFEFHEEAAPVARSGPI